MIRKGSSSVGQVLHQRSGRPTGYSADADGPSRRRGSLSIPTIVSQGGDVRETRLTSLAQRSRVPLLGIIGADDLLGVEVVDRDGNVVGQLHDILLDLRRNRIAYGVLELRRTRKDGERLVAIPWNALFQDADSDRFTINAARERIEEAPLLPSELAT